MKLNNFLASLSKKLLLVIFFLAIIITVILYLWQANKFAFVKHKLADAVILQTDSLYTIKYDSLFFDEIAGKAFLKNIRIVPDTLRIKGRSQAQLPYLLLDISIQSITVTGVKTDKAIIGTEMIGDSIIINSPKILAYFLKPIRKETRIDAEAKEVYQQILGNLDLIQVGHVSIKNAEISAVNFFSHYRQFDINNTNIQLHDVRIDSLHSVDTSRILFCKDAFFHTDQFISYNDNKEEVNVKDITFSGKQHKLSFLTLLLNRFETDKPEGIKLMEANDFFISGINTFEIVKNKNIFIDSILCKHILFYPPPAVNPGARPARKERLAPRDTAGFRKAYSLELRNIYFPDIDVAELPPATGHNFDVGKLALTVRGIKAGEIMEMQLHPLTYTKEVDLFCDNMSYTGNNKVYNYTLQNIRFNSLLKQFSMSGFRMIPLLGEAAFAKNAGVQKDRYEISLAGISLNNIDADKLLEKQVAAADLIVNSSNIKIYRDISYPGKAANKVGNYPSQMLMKSDIPIDIKNARFKNTYLEYKEKNGLSDKAGIVKFEQGEITIANVTNIPAAIKSNNVMTTNYRANVLGVLPINTTFKFFLDANDGKFGVSGTLGSCDAKALNQISMPMAMIKIDTGTIEGANFNFTGNDNIIRGEFVMRYKDFKVALFKKGAEDKGDKRRGFLSAVANTLIKNENPHNGKLRTSPVEYNRDRSKSFFNLVWKAVFTGMKGNFGIPM